MNTERTVTPVLLVNVSCRAHESLTASRMEAHIQMAGRELPLSNLKPRWEVDTLHGVTVPGEGVRGALEQTGMRVRVPS